MIRVPAIIFNSSETLLLQAALNTDESSGKAWREWSTTHDLHQTGTREFAILHHLSQRHASIDFGDDALLLSGLRNRAWAINKQTALLVTGACEVLSSAGLAPVPIRGSALLLDPVVATMRPIPQGELWIDAANWSRSLQLLQERGWQYRHRPRASMTDAVLTQPRGALLLTWGREFPVLRRTPPSFPSGHRNNDALMSDSVGTMLSLLIAEGVMAPSTVTITWPLDAMQVLAGHSTEAGFWNSVIAVSADSGYGSLVAAGLQWLRVQFGADIPEDVVEVLATAPTDPTVMREIAAKGSGRRHRSSSRRRRDIRRARSVEPWSAVPAVSRWSSGIRFLQASSAARNLR